MVNVIIISVIISARPIQQGVVSHRWG